MEQENEKAQAIARAKELLASFEANPEMGYIAFAGENGNLSGMIHSNDGMALAVAKRILKNFPREVVLGMLISSMREDDFGIDDEDRVEAVEQEEGK